MSKGGVGDEGRESHVNCRPLLVRTASKEDWKRKQDGRERTEVLINRFSSLSPPTAHTSVYALILQRDLWDTSLCSQFICLLFFPLF